MINAREAVIGHWRTFLAILIGAGSLFVLPPHLPQTTRCILAWDVGTAAFLAMCLALFVGHPQDMQANARAEEEGEWTLFFLVVAGAAASFGAIINEFGSIKGASPGARDLKVGVVGATLVLSWLVTHAVFALRYAHEYYSVSDAAAGIDGGLDFPDEKTPDYWDFFYFSTVLGMTFQVSDVQVTSRKLRRLATLHGMLGFVFNTVIVALTVNLASGLLG